jgi:hypothetical protein
MIRRHSFRGEAKTHTADNLHRLVVDRILILECGVTELDMAAALAFRRFQVRCLMLVIGWLLKGGCQEDLRSIF